MQSPEVSAAQVKLAFLSMVGYLFDEGIIPGEWVRWNGEDYETVDIAEVMSTVSDNLSGGYRNAR